MSTNHTTNYDLNQWEGTDKVLRTEFNADNAKIDAALKANADAIAAEISMREIAVNSKADQSALCWTKLGEAAAEAACSQLTMALTGITLTDYANLRLYVMGPSQWEVGLRLNGLDSGYYKDKYESDNLCSFDCSGENVAGDADLFCPQAGSPILCHYRTVSGSDMADYVSRPSLQWQDLQSLQLCPKINGTQLSAGLRMILYGLKR